MEQTGYWANYSVHNQTVPGHKSTTQRSGARKSHRHHKEAACDAPRMLLPPRRVLKVDTLILGAHRLLDGEE